MFWFQLIIGNFGLSYEQCKTQMAMWAIFAAPLLMSVDLRTIKPDYKAILKNKKIIAVNQDPLGIQVCGYCPPVPAYCSVIWQGRRIYKQKGIEIWARPIMPVYRAKYSYAIVFLNRRTDGTPSEVTSRTRLECQTPDKHPSRSQSHWRNSVLTIHQDITLRTCTMITSTALSLRTEDSKWMSTLQEVRQDQVSQFNCFS